MESRTKLFGHPIHPMLIVFLLGLLVTTIAFVLSFVGAGLSFVTGWLGGELVDRLAVGVDDGAHLDAPNSLSGRPAREDVAIPATDRELMRNP